MITLFKYNFNYFLVILFFWSTLLENAFSFGKFHQFSNGLDLSVSLFLRVIFLFKTSTYFFNGSLNNKDLMPVVKFIFVLVLFYIYGTLFYPQYFLRSFSVLIQTISVLSIIPYLYLSNPTKASKQLFYTNIRFFILINSILLVISFFYPNLLESFESSSGTSDISRSFGIMGDEISTLLTFFILDAFHNKKWINFLILLFSFFLTGGIASFFILISLVLFYLSKITSLNNKKAIWSYITVIFLFIVVFYFRDQISIFDRINQNFSVQNENNTLNLRIKSITAGIDIFSDNIWFGIGFGFYGAYIQDLFDYLDENVMILTSSYNQYLQILCEMGIIGFLVFISFLYGLLKKLRNKLKVNYTSEKFIAYIWLVTLFITMQSGNWFFPSSFVFILIVSLLGVNLKEAK